MNPIYRFFLSADDGTSQRAYPIYGNNLAKEFAKESGEEFFRATLSGALVFEGPDYDYIFGKPFETIFGIEIKISYDAVNFSSYWKGKFFKINCDFDLDAKTISVKPEVDDDYVAVLAGMDKEYNLIELAPEIAEIKLDKRPMIQVYALGDTSIGCFLSGMWWEQECEEITTDAQLTAKHFVHNKTIWSFAVEGTFSPDIPDVFAGEPFGPNDPTEYTHGEYKLQYVPAGSGTYQGFYNIVRISDDMVMWGATVLTYDIPDYFTLSPMPGSGATGQVVLYYNQVSIYSRVLLDKDEYFGQPTDDIPTNDIVENNRNYHKCIGYGMSNIVFYSEVKTSTPTQWGIYQPGLYYVRPWIPGRPTFPIARSSWGHLSYWFAFTEFDDIYEAEGRKQYTLKDAYPLASAISKILGKIAPGITHAATADYSEFLYDENPLSGTDYRLFLVPKSNILKGEYDQPAQKAPITLRQITDMLRDCFRCYWFIEDKKFKIEHIEYFNGGGEYGGDPDYDVDLTSISVSRSGKKWDFAKNSYSYDDADIPSRMEFGWMDDVTSPFEGDPIDMLSKYAKDGSVEKINIQNFTSDVDYMLLNPSACSDDGFALLAPIEDDGEWVLPYLAIGDSILQNGYMAFSFLQEYYFYDMPCRDFEIGASVLEAYGVKRLRMQDISFPCYEDVDLQKLVKTNLGEGKYEKLSINLSSRMGKATLRYGTE